MNLKGLFTGKDAIAKVVEVIDKVIPDMNQKTELKFELYKIITSSMIAKYVRALLALSYFAVWLFFPENFEGREEMSKYMLYAIAGYYFIVDRSFNKIKK